MNRAWVLVLACACGDDRPQIQVFDPTNGDRLMIEHYQFDDGTRLVEPNAFYDNRIHARCTPQEWFDEVVRCVPDAEEAFYRDATCTTLIGREQDMKFPTHFIAKDTRASDGTRQLARVVRAGEKIDPVPEYFLREGTDEQGMPICSGPFVFPEPNISTQFWDVTDESFELVSIIETELGDARLGLVVRQSNDGAIVPVGFRDRELDVACTPSPRGGAGVCEPLDVPASSYFADRECTQPAILVDPDGPLPPVASTVAPSGCREYHAVDPAPIGRAYRDLGDGACVSVQTTQQVLALRPAAALAEIVRTADTAPKRRVQRILASEGDLHVYADRLFDTATRAECHLAKVGTSLRCIPTSLAPIARLFLPGCTVELRLAEVPAASCDPIEFAANDTGETLELHAIGDPFTGTAYTLDPNLTCVPYTAAAGTSLHSVGPLLPEDTFLGAVAFGAR